METLSGAQRIWNHAERDASATARTELGLHSAAAAAAGPPERHTQHDHSEGDARPGDCQPYGPVDPAFGGGRCDIARPDRQIGNRTVWAGSQNVATQARPASGQLIDVSEERIDQCTRATGGD